MRAYETEIEIIGRYLAGELDPAERHAFENRLSNDEALVAQVRNVKFAIEGIRANAFREKVKSLHENYTAEKRTRVRYQYISGIAASLLILVTASYFLIFKNSQKDFHAYFEPFPVPILVRGEDANENLQAITFYERGDFGKAVQAFNSLPEKDRNDETKFYLGVSLLGNKQPLESSSVLEPLTESENYQGPARWFLALSYLELGEKQKAKILLVQIKKSDYQFDRAQELLTELK